MTNEIETYIKEQIPIICQNYGWEQLALECMPDHAHLFVSAPPTIAPVIIGKTLKSILAVSVLNNFSETQTTKVLE